MQKLDTKLVLKSSNMRLIFLPNSNLRLQNGGCWNCDVLARWSFSFLSILICNVGIPEGRLKLNKWAYSKPQLLTITTTDASWKKSIDFSALIVQWVGGFGVGGGHSFFRIQPWRSKIKDIMVRFDKLLSMNLLNPSINCLTTQLDKYPFAWTYLQPHYGNGVFSNVYLLAGQQH